MKEKRISRVCDSSSPHASLAKHVMLYAESLYTGPMDIDLRKHGFGESRKKSLMIYFRRAECMLFLCRSAERLDRYASLPDRATLTIPGMENGASSWSEPCVIPIDLLGGHQRWGLGILLEVLLALLL